MSDIKELLDNLNLTDECSNIEAKKGSSINRSILETVCAFSNEPAIGGGYILLGLERESETLFSNYKIVGVDNPDKLQLDLSSQCASMFNVPIRPEIRIEKIEGKNILNIFIPELPEAQKPEEYLGEPGSKNRNPNIAAVFHETNLAETKGSGIKSMRDLMEKAKMLPPTFESDHSRNHFTIRLLLHHFLGEEDILWLSSFDEYNLNESQKRAIIFTREVGAIDNSVYRQINYLDKIKASFDLRDLKDKEIFEAKGRGKATYYIPGINLHYSKKEGGESEPVQGESEPVLGESEPVPGESEPVRLSLIDKLSPALKEKLEKNSGRVMKKDMEDFICELCDENDFSITQLSILLNKRDKYLLNRFIKPLREMGRLKYTIPDMPNHPQQTYRTIKKS